MENNYAYSKGGGVALFDQSGSQMFNNLIAGNETATAGGIIIQSSPGCYIINCTVSDNQASLIGGAITTYQFSYPVIRNSIVYANHAPNLPCLHYSFDDSFAVSYSDIEGGWEGIGILDEPPLFASGYHGNYYLCQTAAGQPNQSPVVDSGDSLSAISHLDTMTTRTDHVGDSALVDMGFHYVPYPISGLPKLPNPPQVPAAIRMQVFPNPFNSTTMVRLSLPIASPVELDIYDILGRRVAILARDNCLSGNHTVAWSARNSQGNPVATGCYFVQLTTSREVHTARILYLK
jgi:hypothetical protein